MVIESCCRDGEAAACPDWRSICGSLGRSWVCSQACWGLGDGGWLTCPPRASTLRRTSSSWEASVFTAVPTVATSVNCAVNACTAVPRACRSVCTCCKVLSGAGGLDVSILAVKMARVGESKHDWQGSRQATLRMSLCVTITIQYANLKPVLYILFNFCVHPFPASTENEPASASSAAATSPPSPTAAARVVASSAAACASRSSCSCWRRAAGGGSAAMTSATRVCSCST